MCCLYVKYYIYYYYIYIHIYTVYIYIIYIYIYIYILYIEREGDRERDPNWLNGWVFVYELSSCGFKSHFSHLNLRYRACFEQGVPWHSTVKCTFTLKRVCGVISDKKMQSAF